MYRQDKTAISIDKGGSLPGIEYENIKRASMILSALNNRFRRAIITTLHLNRMLSVTELYQALRINQSTASMHLGLLRRAGIVLLKRKGQNNFYSVNYKKVVTINEQCKIVTAAI